MENQFTDPIGFISEKENTENILNNIYYNVSNPDSFGSIDKLYKNAKAIDKKITRDEVKNWLKAQITYTLHRNKRQNFERNRIIVTTIDEQWEADLVEMQEFARQNKGIRYILTVIDCFSKHAWALPLKTKGAGDVSNAFKKIFKERKPEVLRTDNGKEFLNTQYSSLYD